VPPTGAGAEAAVLPAPAEALELSDGSHLQLGAERGKVFVLVFYAAWCPVSRKMLRALTDIATPSRRQRGLVVLAIDEEDGDAEATQFAKAAGLTGPVGLDRSGDFTRAMKLDTVPALVAVGRDGVVRRSHAGYHGEADLAELGREVDALLAAPRAGPPAGEAPAPVPSASAAPAR
jgi:peroxiredoxin